MDSLESKLFVVGNQLTGQSKVITRAQYAL